MYQLRANARMRLRMRVFFSFCFCFFSSGMRCIVCEIPKLANEFPPEALTEECKHYLGVCLRVNRCSRGLNALCRVFAISSKRDNFCDFLFALRAKPLLKKRCLSYKE